MSETKSAPQNLSSALQEAQAIVDGAKRRAAEMLSDAESKVAEAGERGYRLGFEEGLRQAADSAIRLVASSAGVRDALAHEAAKFAFAIAEKVIGGHIETSPETVIAIAKNAVRDSVSGYSITIISNPDDVQLLKEREHEFRRLAGNAEVKIEGDASLSRGGCIVRSEFGEVDASLEALLARLAERLGVDSHG